MEWIEKDLLFYHIMNYPIPTQKHLFATEKKIEGEYIPSSTFSREKKNEHIDEFKEIINKYGRLYRSIPFIKQIFICNSISFNAVKKDSDIDIFIITKKNAIWRARLFSTLFFLVTWLKRSYKKKEKKFCLSFYVTEDHQNLYSIMLPKTDIYLSYWLAHLIPLYSEGDNVPIYTHNKRFSTILPNHPQKYCINIWTKQFHGNSRCKKIFERILWWIFWNIREILIRTCRIPILIKKTKQHGKKWWWIIINDDMLKFHMDKRKEISFLYNWAREKLPW